MNSYIKSIYKVAISWGSRMNFSLYANIAGLVQTVTYDMDTVTQYACITITHDSL